MAFRGTKPVMSKQERQGASLTDARPRLRRGARFAVFIAVGVILLAGSTVVSYFVDALWFESLGLESVFWTRLSLQAATFGAFALVTFVMVYGVYRALAPSSLSELIGTTILINRRPVTLPVESIQKLIGLVLSAIIAALTGASMMQRWMTLALFWQAPRNATLADPIFGRPLDFYFFTLPVLQLVSGWLLTLSIIACLIAAGSVLISGGTGIWMQGRTAGSPMRLWRGLSISLGAFLMVLAVRAYLGRYDTLFQDGTVFSGVTYTDAHITLGGTLVICLALVAGAVMAWIAASSTPRPRWLLASAIPAIACYLLLAGVRWYVSGFIVAPNQLVRERPFIAHNIEMTRRAYALDRIETHPFPADTGIEAVDAADNQTTLGNIRLWDVRALQDTLRQIQEIRTYYDFPDIDIDRYEIEGSVRQMMLAVRELNVEKLPQSSRNWINEKLIYTHGYGVTMNPVNGFTPEGLPTLILSNMPVQSTVPDLGVTRPEIYFGELTDTDVYVKTHQKEFNYPQGDANNLTSYQGDGGIRLGGWWRRTLIAFDRGDIAKLPFSDDVDSESRLLMRRKLSDRVQELAPFLTFDPDPYVVIGGDGRLYWLMDAFTTSDGYPYARRVTLGNDRINYIRNSVKVLIDAYTGQTTFYVFDADDPLIAAYRKVFPGLFADAASMPADLRKHVRYPELLLNVQAAVYGLYHMTNPDVFYNREDLWTVAAGVGAGDERQQTMAPNFVLMTLPGERASEFIAILPFTPANRNNLIGWIAGRSDGAHYGEALVYDFPKTKLIDGPLQIEARIDQNAELSGQLTLWNQQGSHVRRGSLIVIPIGRALLYAEPIYLQAERSPMPELRLVVLAVQDRLAYGPTFETAMAALFGTAPSLLTTHALTAAPASRMATPATGAAAAPSDVNALISVAARDFEDYQQLTAAGKLAEAGEKLEELKRTLEALQAAGRH
jgi:uncharacterized membrane protein (UPF0182 family)